MILGDTRVNLVDNRVNPRGSMVNLGDPRVNLGGSRVNSMDPLGTLGRGFIGVSVQDPLKGKTFEKPG